jgi:hypothetical protein
MADCPNLQKCPFFNDKLANMPTVSGYLKKQFCRDIYNSCARYLVAQSIGSTIVPADLFPTEKQRAQEIIAKESFFKKRA